MRRAESRSRDRRSKLFSMSTPNRQKKRRGDFPCGISPLLSDFSKIWFGLQITTTLSPRTGSGPANLAARPSFTLCGSLRCKSFLGSIQSFRLPVRLARPVAGSPDGPCPLSPLEDLSSVDLKHTPHREECNRCGHIFRCGNDVKIVEMKHRIRPRSTWSLRAVPGDLLVDRFGEATYYCRAAESLIHRGRTTSA